MNISRRNDLKRLTIFGFSANPPTDDSGHGGIIKFLVESGDYDEVWLLPVYRHIYKEKSNLAPFEYRMEMCQLLADRLTTATVVVKAKNLEQLVYLDFLNTSSEDSSRSSIGTIDVLRYIRKNFKEYDLRSINLGSDTFNDLMDGKWKESEQVMKQVEINVFARLGQGSSIRDCPSGAKGIRRICLEKLGATSSSGIRSKKINFLQLKTFHEILCDHKWNSAVYSEVYDYIQTKRLYFYDANACPYLRLCYALEDLNKSIRRGLSPRIAVSSISLLFLAIIVLGLFYRLY
jgi:nicotinic acid mononucleotide adenylyltransferase